MVAGTRPDCARVLVEILAREELPNSVTINTKTTSMSSLLHRSGSRVLAASARHLIIQASTIKDSIMSSVSIPLLKSLKRFEFKNRRR